jgi:hypothetical protein
MIFRKKPKSPVDVSAEPVTRLDPFPAVSDQKSGPLKNRFTKDQSSAAPKQPVDDEPPTRDAVFEQAPLPVKKAAGDENLPIGWIIIIDGPGRGHSAPLRYGDNIIGRAGTASIRLDFGDEKMADEHANIIYDEKKRSFHIKLGEKKRKMKDREKFELGNTELMFLAVCDDSFDWRAPAVEAQD